MAAKTKVMKHLLDFAGDGGCVFVTVIACPTPGLVDKIVVAFRTLSICVIDMVEANGQHGLRDRVAAAIVFSNKQQKNRQHQSANCKWPHRAP
jgi:hypothetical protein